VPVIDTRVRQNDRNKPSGFMEMDRLWDRVAAVGGGGF